MTLKYSIETFEVSMIEIISITQNLIFSHLSPN